MILIKLLLLINLLPEIATADHHVPSNCSKSCGTRHRLYLPYPFGFSSGCPIRLNCSSTGEALVGDFPVRSAGPDTVRLSIESKCNRSVAAVDQLFGPNFAPTWRNAILFENCSRPAPCKIPATSVQTNFESTCSSANNNVSTMRCYSEKKTTGFLDRGGVSRTDCRYLTSAILADRLENSSVSLDVKVVELGWWLDGDCECVVDADCTSLVSPVTGKMGFRCRCRRGLVGDGYLAGVGCHKASHCGLSKYIAGQCGGTARFGILLGGIVGGASLMIILGLLCCFIKKQAHSKSQKTTKQHLQESTGITIPIYTYKEIERATNNFSDKQRLGTGAYGTVYSAKLRNNELVAIKRIKQRDTNHQFLNEISLISSLSHPNLVQLLGCSIDKGEQILVYEYMPNGTLSQHLDLGRGSGLPWPARLTIATETARALAYLHSSIDPPIYHRDVKSSNILLNTDFTSKIADFGLSRLGIDRNIGMTEISHVSTAPQGTPGYLDPQYHQNFHLSDKSDVYSFGVVLIEIITAMKVVDFSRAQNEVNLANLAIDRIGKGRVEEIVDPVLVAGGDEGVMASIRKVAEVAFRCLAFHRDMRPCMVEVAGELEKICLEAHSRAQILMHNLLIKKQSLGELLVSVESSSMERMTEDSPGDSWMSEASSPSSNSLLSNVVQ